MRKLVWLCGLFLALAVPAMAQDQTPKAEIFGGYSYVRANGGGTSINFNGGSGSIAYNPNNWFGIVADFGGYHASQSGVSGNIFSYLFGPKISYRKNDKVTPFAQALFGGARASASVTGASGSTNAFAMTLGGGLDWNATQHFGIRLIQAEYFLTKFNLGPTSQHQNNARISAGVVIRF